MQSENISVYESNSREETFRFAKEIAEQANAGEVYCLNGDLGVGKTAFAQGFGAGLGITEPMPSPTFTILHTYEEGRLPLYHFDVYRIGSEDEMEEIGYFDLVDGGEGIALIEWSKLISGIIPKDAIEVEIEKMPEKGLDYRKITIRKNA